MHVIDCSTWVAGGPETGDVPHRTRSASGSEFDTPFDMVLSACSAWARCSLIARSTSFAVWRSDVRSAGGEGADRLFRGRAGRLGWRIQSSAADWRNELVTPPERDAKDCSAWTVPVLISCIAAVEGGWHCVETAATQRSEMQQFPPGSGQQLFEAVDALVRGWR